MGGGGGAGVGLDTTEEGLCYVTCRICGGRRVYGVVWWVTASGPALRERRQHTDTGTDRGVCPHRSWLNEQVLESGPGLIISTFVCVIIGARHANTSPHRHAAKPAS